MADIFPDLEKRGWQVDYGLALGPTHNRPKAFAQVHSYMRRTHLIDGRAMTSAARQRAIRHLLRLLQPDLLMPIAIGDAVPALLAERALGCRSRVLVPIHSLHAGTLGDVAAFAGGIDMVAGVSGLIYRWACEQRNLGPQRSRWIRNGAPAATANRRMSSGPLRVGYVGRVDHNSLKRVLDIPAVVRAAADTGAKLSLTVAGDGPLRSALEADLTGNVALAGLHALGFCQRDALYRNVYPALDCLLLTSSTEGSPLVVIEAMHNGVVPVVSEFLGNASEGLLRPGENCLVFPVGDTQAAGAQLSLLDRDRALLSRLSARARESVAKQYTTEAMREGWAAAADEVLTLPPCPASVPIPTASQHGRLDRLGLPAGAVDWLRRCTPKRPVANGFDEWPGSVLNSDAAICAINSRLGLIEDECGRGTRVQTTESGES